MVVHDTPASNDYGADLIVEYNGCRIAGQCKYYEKSVGVKAVQEVLGALAYYNCEAGAVFTNSTFTQQAISLASANRVLLIDGDMLQTYISNYNVLYSAFDRLLFAGSRNVEQPQRQSEEWTINDLVIRYGVSNQTIMKNFLGYGLPYFKVGREYRFYSYDVFWWEVDTHYVPYGKNGRIALPGYDQYRKSMNAQIKTAKANKDTETVKRLKEEMRSHRVRRISDTLMSNLTYLICILILLSLLVGLYFYIMR